MTIVAHELWHLTSAQYRGTLGAAEADPDIMELTPELAAEIGAWNLEKVLRKMNLQDFSEERACDTFALQRLRAWRRRGSLGFEPNSERGASSWPT